MMKTIDIGSVTIPLDSYVVGGTALLGIRESGKTYAAKGIAEQLLDYKIPIVVFDAIGVWRFLKVASQGGRAFKVVVAGGKHPDLPLTPDSAPEIVRAAIRENIPLVIDLYDEKLSKGDWRRIVQKCFRTLLYENHGLRHIFLEEAAEYAPQKVFDGETYAEVEKLVRMGGNKSLGITLINQRAQEMNKAVLDLCENLVLMRQRGAHAIDALERWIDKLEPDVAKQIAREMPHMEQGDAWVFTGGADKAKRVHTAKIHSFHPDRRKPDAKAITTRSIDTADFVSRMSGELTKVIEQSQANDPKKLRAELAARDRDLAVRDRQIARLTHDLANKKAPAARVDTKALEQAAYQRGMAEGLKELQRDRNFEHKDLRRDLHEAIDTVMNHNAPMVQPRDLVKTAIAAKPVPPQPRITVGDPVITSGGKALRIVATNVSSDLPKGEAKILAALIQFPSGRTRQQLGVLTGYATRSLTTYLPKLIDRGYIENLGGLLHATHEGHAALPDARPLPQGEALQEHWRGILPEGERKILDVLIEHRGQPVSREEIQQATSYATRSITTYVPRLAAKGLVVATRGELRASEDLF